MRFFFGPPRWRQLLSIWVAAVAIAVVLLLIESAIHAPGKFFYLIPYPSSFRSAVAMVGQAFRTAPLVATAVIGVPLLALLMTVTLLGAQLMRLRGSA